MNIHEVAKAAGVSVATVSRVVNHPEIVSEKTRERVLAAMESAQYATGRMKNESIPKKTKTIAVLLPSLRCYEGVYDGVRSVGRNKDYSVQLCLTESDENDIMRSVRGLIAQQVDGVILAIDGKMDLTIPLFKEAGIPYVCICLLYTSPSPRDRG